MMAAAGPRQTPGPGDLGRRIAQRRRDRGLSRKDLAHRARMAESYVEYLEENAGYVPLISVSRLALALDTSVDELLGGAVELPRASVDPPPARVSRPSTNGNAARTWRPGASVASCSRRSVGPWRYR
jgi:transcriptional regulator with XRE-family HTH domain